MRRTIVVCWLLLLVGCTGGISGSKRYQVLSEHEKHMFSEANRNMFPDDVRNNFTENNHSLVVWSGIVKESKWRSESKSEIIIFVEHHYWDWIEDYGLQPERAFLSPRGEGMFSCARPSPKGIKYFPLPSVGSMAIVYGYPERIEASTQTISLKCEKVVIKPREWYTTEKWDYGRNYLLHGDKSDFDGPVSYNF